jgi:hypothetical protein
VKGARRSSLVKGPGVDPMEVADVVLLGLVVMAAVAMAMGL